MLDRGRLRRALDRQARVRRQVFDRVGWWRHMLGCGRHGLDFALGLCALDRFALDLVARAVACALSTRVTAPGTMVGLGLGGALRALVLCDQRLPVGDRNLVVVGMDFA